MNFCVIILLWQHILYLCTLFLVQGGKWTGYSQGKKLYSMEDYYKLISKFQNPVPSSKDTWWLMLFKDIISLSSEKQ